MTTKQKILSYFELNLTSDFHSNLSKITSVTTEITNYFLYTNDFYHPGRFLLVVNLFVISELLIPLQQAPPPQTKYGNVV